jgi:prevent-host-death family protein
MIDVALVPVRELRNNTAAVIERARRGEDVTITVNGVAAAKLVAVTPDKREFLTTADLLAMRPKPGTVVPEFWGHELEGDTTDDLGPIQ